MMQKVLFVEDDFSFRRAIRFFLELFDVQVVEASSFNQGQKWLQSEAFDVLILDVKLPNGQGLELLRGMRAVKDDIPCLVMSGYPEFRAEVEALDDLTFWIPKPPDIKLFQEKFEAILGLAKTLRELKEGSAKLRGAIGGGKQ